MAPREIFRILSNVLAYKSRYPTRGIPLCHCLCLYGHLTLVPTTMPVVVEAAKRPAKHPPRRHNATRAGGSSSNLNIAAKMGFAFAEKDKDPRRRVHSSQVCFLSLSYNLYLSLLSVCCSFKTHHAYHNRDSYTRLPLIRKFTTNLYQSIHLRIL